MLRFTSFLGQNWFEFNQKLNCDIFGVLTFKLIIINVIIIIWFKSCKYMISVTVQIMLLMQGIESNPGPLELNSKTN